MNRAKMQWLVVVCCLSLALPLRGHAQSAVPPAPSVAATAGAPPTVEQILERSTAAIGGKDAWMQITSMHLKGSVEVAGATVGSFEKFDKAPNKSFERIDLGAAGVALQGYDGANGWKAEPGRNAEDLQGDELEDARLDSDFYGAIRIANLYPKLVLQGEALADGHNCYAIVGTPEHGTPRTFYFDKESGLWIGMSGESKSGGKSVHVESYFENYKAVKGISVPFSLRIKTDAMTAVVHISVVEMNQVIMNSGFAKPLTRPTSNFAASASASAGASAGAGMTEATPAAAGVSGNTYTDRTYGFSYTFPEGWTPHGDATNKTLMEVGKRIVAGQNAVQQAVADAAFQRTKLLLSVFQYPLGTPDVKNENILVMSEQVDFAPGIRTGEDYLQILKANYKRAPIRCEFGDEIAQYTIAGKVFYRLDIQMHGSNGIVYQSAVATKLGTHVLGFMFTGVNRQDVDGLVGTMNSVKFF